MDKTPSKLNEADNEGESRRVYARFPDQLIESLDRLEEEKSYVSRSEVLREAVRRMADEEL